MQPTVNATASTSRILHHHWIAFSALCSPSEVKSRAWHCMPVQGCVRPAVKVLQALNHARSCAHFRSVANRLYRCVRATKAEQGYPSGQAILTVSAGTHLTTAAHEVWANFVHSGDTVVDATAGNGGDTLWLAKAIGPDGTAHVFDKQDTVGQGCASLICFNLGYLPGSEQSKELTATRKETTVTALNAAVKVIKTKGLISIMAYVGHAGGLEEYEAVRQFMQSLLPAQYTCTQHSILNRPTAPVIMLIQVK